MKLGNLFPLPEEIKGNTGAVTSEEYIYNLIITLAEEVDRLDAVNALLREGLGERDHILYALKDHMELKDYGISIDCIYTSDKDYDDLKDYFHLRMPEKKEKEGE